ncbi:hypothetical protein HHI36_010011 [Cryptolaemus montrouzieri]|uniref:WW domain-containing protein n=1 Tax=Cryptolaemus montrouzieri TaxID=559131 RepID=A0ABD2MHJ3_9CUCU
MIRRRRVSASNNYVGSQEAINSIEEDSDDGFEYDLAIIPPELSIVPDEEKGFDDENLPTNLPNDVPGNKEVFIRDEVPLYLVHVMDSSQTNTNLTEWNTETNLQALFDSVLTPSTNLPQQVPWCMRKLPHSFFNPPTTGSKSIDHSRENSSDSGTFTSPGIFTTCPLNSIPLQTVHHRAHSSPATLQQVPISMKESSSYQHLKQHSCDVVSGKAEVSLPFGWEQAVTPEGQMYYLNHITKTTTWEDPRKFRNTQNQSQTSEASEISTDILGPLPEGWKQSSTPEGEIYFINHLTRTTSWFDPRIPIHLQRVRPELMTTASWYSIHVKEQDMRLHLERGKLKQRREELRKHQVLNSNNSMLDHFTTGSIVHERQESSDSANGDSLKDWNTFQAISSSFDVTTYNLLPSFNNTIVSGNDPTVMNDLPELDSSEDIVSSQQYSIESERL